MSASLGSGQEKRFYDVYMQRMHRSGKGLVNMKERTEGVYVIMLCRIFREKNPKKRISKATEYVNIILMLHVTLN